MSPPGDIREGSSVNLSCVSQANPPANRYEEYVSSRVINISSFLTSIKWCWCFTETIIYDAVPSHHAPHRWFCLRFHHCICHWHFIPTFTVLQGVTKKDWAIHNLKKTLCNNGEYLALENPEIQLLRTREYGISNCPVPQSFSSSSSSLLQVCLVSYPRGPSVG